MKGTLISVLIASILLSGCFETTQEITINEDGTGTVSTTSDLSAVVGLSKQMGAGDDVEKAMEAKVDTTISLAAQADSLENISETEKSMLKKGSMWMKVDMKDDVFLTKLSFPFTSTDEIPVFERLTGKIFGNAMKKQMAESALGAAAGGDVPEFKSFDDYYDLKLSKDELKKSLNKDRYATAKDDEYLKSMKEASGMGLPVTATYIINLPRPATKAEGKNVVLSEDKRKVTVKVDIDDFFDNPEKLEYKIKF